MGITGVPSELLAATPPDLMHTPFFRFFYGMKIHLDEIHPETLR